MEELKDLNKKREELKTKERSHYLGNVTGEISLGIIGIEKLKRKRKKIEKKIFNLIEKL